MAICRAQFSIKRLFSSFSSSNALEFLKDRSLLHIQGPDVSEFIQSLITNDINHIRENMGSMYAMFLNTRGRVLFDSLIYKGEENDCYLIECDSRVRDSLHKHLKIYKVRRKVDISNCDKAIHVLYNPHTTTNRDARLDVLDGEFDKKKLPDSSSDVKIFNDICIYKDPRVAQLGFRIISSKPSIEAELKHITNFLHMNLYKKLRYSLGVGEGIEDLPPDACFPLESNCDYLHGVSFHKGCYIGQELTARTHHTGVIRKRLMPLWFTKRPTNLPENNIIMHNDKNLGKLRGVEDDTGLGLLRVGPSLQFGTISIENGEATVVRPHWWPLEMPKEKLKIN